MFYLALVAGWDISEFRFYRTSAEAKAAQDADPEIVLFGTGFRVDLPEGRVVLDEHDPRSRLPGECGATLLAKHLDLSEKEELRDILAYALRADTESGQKYFELAELIKCLHGYSELDNEGVWAQIVRPVYEAVLGHALSEDARPIGSFSGGTMPGKDVQIQKIVLPQLPSWQACAAAWVLMTLRPCPWKVGTKTRIVFADDPGAYVSEKGVFVVGDDTFAQIVSEFAAPVRKGAAKLTLDECERWLAKPGEVLPFELPTLIERLRTHGRVDSAAILQIAGTFFSARLRRSEAFREAMNVDPDAIGRGALTVALAVNDNLEAAASLRGRKVGSEREFDVIILRKEDGHVNIFFNDAKGAPEESKKAPRYLPAIARALIRAESAARGETHLVDERLAALEAAGDAAWKGFPLLGWDKETWYVSYGALHNGTTTHPEVEPTRLTGMEIFRTVRAAIASVAA